jgi:hypothetical protein
MATPPLIGYLVDVTHSFVPGLLLLAGVLAVASSLIWMVGPGSGRKERSI